MKLDFRWLTNLYQRLSARERTLVGLAGGAVLVISLYLLVWQPLEDGRAQLTRSITVKKNDLNKMQEMRDAYLDLRSQFELRQGIIKKADPKFSLFPHIESTVGLVVGRDHIASMNPQNKDIAGIYREDSVEIKLTAVSLAQLVDLMYRIEKDKQPLRITRLQIKKRPREPQQFDVTATVSMLKPLETT